jgi:hypothetical protein
MQNGISIRSMSLLLLVRQLSSERTVREFHDGIVDLHLVVGKKICP